MKHNGITLHGAPKFKAAPPIPEIGRLKDICSGTAEVFKLDPRFIQRDPGFNTRYDFGDISILAEDILENGVLEALKVRKEGNTIFLVNGDRRLTAIKQLISNGLWPADPKNPGHPLPVPCTSEGRDVKPLDRLFMMLSLNTGKPFNLLEKGFAYRKILDDSPDINASEIARRSGETKQAVSNALQIVTLASPALIQHIKDEHLSASTALDIIKVHSDHAAQDAGAAAAIAAAKEHGRDRATPKDLPAKPAKPAAKDMWTHAPETCIPDAEGTFDLPSATFLTEPKFGISKLSLLTGQSPDSGRWFCSFAFQTKKGGKLGQVTTSDTKSFPDENTALRAAWHIVAPLIMEHAKTGAPLMGLAIRNMATAAGQALAARFPTGLDADDSLFAGPTPPAPDADDNDDDDSNVIIPDPEDEPTSKDAPADPDAYQRIKDAKSTNRDGSGSEGGGGSGFATPDKRMKNVEDMLNDLDKESCNQSRWDSFELLLDYLNGAHTVATLKKHLAA